MGEHAAISGTGHPSHAVQTFLSSDKQLAGITLAAVLERRALDQALNAKEFAVLTGISYSTAREWFRLPGFPVLRGVVFWADFAEWRRIHLGLNDPSPSLPPPTGLVPSKAMVLPPRSHRILAEAGLL